MAATSMAITAAVVAALLSSGPSSDPADLSIPIDTAIAGGVESGGEAPLTRVASADLDGSRCDVRAVRRESATETHSGNDLVVTSGDGRVTLEDVERQPGAVTAGGPLAIGPTISVVLVMGEDERFAAAIDLQFRCDTDGGSVTPANGAADDGSIPAGTPDATSTDGGPTATTTAALVGGLVALVGGAAMLVGWRRNQRTEDVT